MRGIAAASSASTEPYGAWAVAGVLRMKYSQFVVWNFIVGAVQVPSVGPAAYGAGKVSAHEQNGASMSALLAGLAIAGTCIVLATRYYRRRKAHRLLADVASTGTSPLSG